MGSDDKATRPAGASLSMAGPVVSEDHSTAPAPESARPVTRGELHALLDDTGLRDVAGIARALRVAKSPALIGALSLAVGAGAGAGFSGVRSRLAADPSQPSPQPDRAPAPAPAPTEFEREAQEPEREAQEPEQCEAARAQCEAADASERRCTREARRVVAMLDTIADECGIEPAMRVSGTHFPPGPGSSSGVSPIPTRQEEP